MIFTHETNKYLVRFILQGTTLDHVKSVAKQMEHRTKSKDINCQFISWTQELFTGVYGLGFFVLTGANYFYPKAEMAKIDPKAILMNLQIIRGKGESSLFTKKDALTLRLEQESKSADAETEVEVEQSAPIQMVMQIEPTTPVSVHTESVAPASEPKPVEPVNSDADDWMR